MCENWTSDQLLGLSKSGDVVVAAAAGSGKTSVLVERVIRIVSCKRIDIDKLLVLTFTQAAATEVRQRIYDAICNKIKGSNDEHLQKQVYLLEKATISTIHAFCLESLRNSGYFYDEPIVASDDEARVLKRQALDCVLERFYFKIEAHPAFILLCTGYGGTRNDEQLRRILLSLSDFCGSLPCAASWFNGCIKEYSTALGFEDIGQSLWGRVVLGHVAASLGRCAHLSWANAEFVKRNLGYSHGYYELFIAEGNMLKSVADISCLSWDEARYLIGTIVFENCGRYSLRGDDQIRVYQNQARKRRDAIKTEVNKTIALIKVSSTTSKERIKKVIAQLKVLKGLTLALDRKYRKLKLAKGLVDFNDLERETLKLLKNPNSPSKRPYYEVFIDEYQDVNKVQSEIIKRITTDNIFIVGDIKQCIYKFRNSDPELFAKEYLSGIESGNLVFLSDNFRSQKNIINFVNTVFSELMTKSLGGVDYDQGQQLRYCGDFTRNNTVELCLIDSSNKLHESEQAENKFDCHENVEESGDNENEQAQDDCDIDEQAKFIALKIRDMVNNFEICTKDGVRKARYSDFAILVRANSCLKFYQNIFHQYEIPLTVDYKEKYLNSVEIIVIISFLSIICNPLQDIPLISVLKQVFNFTPEELAQIRLEGRNCYFYEAMKKYAPKCPKTRNFLERYEKMRTPTLSIPQIIWHIYKDFDYLNIVKRTNNNRCKDLMMLLDQAIKFEKNNDASLASFIDIIKDMRKNTPAMLDNNTVKIITIHKSKGLEFPIVFLADINRRFNKIDINSLPIIWHDSYGIGIECIDGVSRTRYLSIQKEALRILKDLDLLSEEMRILYVALTRARDKLIIVGNLDKNVQTDARKASSFFDWIVTKLSKHKSAGKLREIYDFSDANDFNFDLDVVLVQKNAQQT